MSAVLDLGGKLAGAVAGTGDVAPALLFFATFVEYVFPPFPGDLVVVLGAWAVVQGTISWPLAFAAVTGGAVAGAWVDWWIGAAIGRRMDRRQARRGVLSTERLERFEAAYRRHGAALLVLNRFMPGVRAFVFVAAGASGIPLRKVLVYGGVSATLWNAVLLGAGALVAKNAGELVHLVEHYTAAAWAVLAVAVLAVALVAWRRRRASARREAAR